MPVDVCDGWEQCPQGDDEWLCDVGPCPGGCFCQGLAFLCHKPFSPVRFPALRYLDVQNTPLNVSLLPEDTRVYLIYLRVNNGSCVEMPRQKLNNLQTLDLSGNNIEHVNMADMLLLPRLKFLQLSSNPVSMLYSTEIKQTFPLQVLDLSSTHIETFDSALFSFLRDLHTLDLSNSLLRSIGDGGFKSFPYLKTLDLRKTLLLEDRFPWDVFQGLQRLSVVHTPNYRLCCAHVMSMTIKPRCVTNEKTLSSCENLLRSSAHRVVMVTLSMVAVAGNAVCMLIRYVKYKEHVADFSLSLLLTNVNAANLLNGVHCAIVAIADYKFRSEYLSHEMAWRRSSACTAAGFLSVLSRSASASLLLLMITDIILKHSFSTRTCFRFYKRLVIAALVTTWCVSLDISLVPELPSSSSWTFYGHTALCLPLLGRFSHSGGTYHFILDGVIPMIVFVFVALGLLFIYKLSLNASSPLPPHPTLLACVSEDTARQRDMPNGVFKLVVTDCARAGMLGCVSLVTYVGDVAVEEDVAAHLSIALLQLHAALSPCLYVLSHVMAERRRETQRRLLQLLTLRKAHNEQGRWYRPQH
jgi:Leucine-rich repeat (LRR) protein